MKFVKYPQGRNHVTESIAREQSCRFIITRLSDGAEAMTNRRPRRDSKVWNSWEYMIWDCKNKLAIN